MGKDLITRTVSRAYEERKLTGKTIDQLIFNTQDNDLSAGFRMDRYISSPFGLSYRNLNNGSIVRRFQPGTTELIEVPIASEKTPINEELQDAIAVGMEPTQGQKMALAKNIDQIMGDHLEGNYMTRCKQAITVLSTGVFPAFGDDGVDLGLGYDHGRAGGNSITYDFTAVGATFNEALLDISQKMDASNTPKTNRAIIMGSDWLAQFGSDSGVLEVMKANGSNDILLQERFARQFGEVDGLYVIAQYKPIGATAPFWILDYTPATSYVAYEGATPGPFVPATEALAFSLNDKTYRINRGVNALDDMGRAVRRVGDMVVDSYTDKDPVTIWVRSQTRHMFVYGNIDHTVKSTGTFA